MKVKIKIIGWDETTGVQRSFKRTIECPDFVEKTESVTLSGHTVDLTDTVDDQVTRWIYDNWQELGVKPCEERFIHPIMGFEFVKPKVDTEALKRDMVLTLFASGSHNWNDEFKAIVIGTLAEMWPVLKKHSPESIYKIVLESVSVTTKVGTALLKGISDTLKGVDSQTSLQLDTKF